MLPNVTELEGEAAGELLLHREVPLLSHGRTEVRVEDLERGRTDKASKCEGRGALCRNRARKAGSYVLTIGNGGTRESRRPVLGEELVGAATFCIGGDAISRTNDGFSMQCRRRPRHADARLPIAGTKIVVVEGVVVLLLMDLAINEPEVNLPVVNFIQGSVIFETEAVVDGERNGNAPIILSEETVHIPSAPKLSSAAILAAAGDQTEPEIRGPLGGNAAKIQCSENAIVSGIDEVKALTPVLEAAVDGMPAARPGDVVFELSGSGMEHL